MKDFTENNLSDKKPAPSKTEIIIKYAIYETGGILLALACLIYFDIFDLKQKTPAILAPILLVLSVPFFLFNNRIVKFLTKLDKNKNKI